MFPALVSHSRPFSFCSSAPPARLHPRHFSVSSHPPCPLLLSSSSPVLHGFPDCRLCCGGYVLVRHLLLQIWLMATAVFCSRLKQLTVFRDRPRSVSDVVKQAMPSAPKPNVASGDALPLARSTTNWHDITADDSASDSQLQRPELAPPACVLQEPARDPPSCVIQEVSGAASGQVSGEAEASGQVLYPPILLVLCSSRHLPQCYTDFQIAGFAVVGTF